MDMITSMVAEKPVVIFCKSNRCLSFSIKSLISSFGANPTVYEIIDQMINGKQIETELLQLGSQPSVPSVFIGQKFIGGAHKIMNLHVRNELPTLFLNDKAIWIWTPKNDSQKCSLSLVDQLVIGKDMFLSSCHRMRIASGNL